MFALSGLRSCASDDEEQEAGSGGSDHDSGSVAAPQYEPPAEKPVAVGEPFRVHDGVVELADAAGHVDVSEKGDGWQTPTLTVDVFPETPGTAAPVGGKP